MFECQLVHELKRRETENRKLARGLQPAAPTQLVELLTTSRVCPYSNGNDAMKSSTLMVLGKRKSPLPQRPIPNTNTNNNTSKTYIAFGTVSGGTSRGPLGLIVQRFVRQASTTLLICMLL